MQFLIVLQNINVPVTCAHAEVLGGRAVPLILNFRNIQDPPSQMEALGMLFAPIPGIAFDLDFTHHLFIHKSVSVSQSLSQL